MIKLIGNFVTSLDFAPNGESVAITFFYGGCLITDINTNELKFLCEPQGIIGS